MNKAEQWKRMIYHGEDLGDFYLVSNLGRIKGVKSGKVRSQNVNHEGYYFVVVSLGSRKVKPCIKPHRAVAETFIDNPNNYPIINHIDGNKLNNCVENLEWCTYSHNGKHAIMMGLVKPKVGTEQGQAKLTEDDVRYIREHYKPRDAEYGARPLGRKFGVAHTCILKVASNESYRNVI